METEEITRIAEAILFASGDPVETERICLVTGLEPETVDEALKKLADELSFQRRGIRLIRLNQAWQLTSAGEFSEYVTRALETRKPPRLSSSALETLSVIAYYQPTTKAFVEQIRGVDCSYTISALLNKKLIEEQGRLQVPGRPILYATTPGFLRTFGLSSLEELPAVELPQIQTAQQLELQLAAADHEEEAAP